MNRESYLREIECIRLISKAQPQFTLFIENSVADRVHLEEDVFAAEEGQVRVLAVSRQSKLSTLIEQMKSIHMTAYFY